MKDRDRRIVEMRAGGWTLVAIGREVGITRERVRKILVERGVEHCPLCRRAVVAVSGGLCWACGKLVELLRDETLAASEAAGRVGANADVARRIRREMGVKGPWRRKYFKGGIPEVVFDRRKSPTAIARELGVPVNAVRHIRTKRGLTGHLRPSWRRGPAWTAEEDRMLAEMRRAGKTLQEMAQRLGRSVSACRQRTFVQRGRGIVCAEVAHG